MSRSPTGAASGSRSASNPEHARKGGVTTSSWKLADRTLELSEPIAAGIVNVTSDSMFEGARSFTPERAVEDGRGLVEAGFEMLDVGAVAAKAGPPVSSEE